MDDSECLQLAKQLIGTARAAGQAEMEIYRQDFQVERKADNSPVTEADKKAEAIILKQLARIAPDIPVVAEEAASAGDIPQTGARFFLVDPLDGTKEFIRKSGEFTVNIALIEHGRPVFGLVYAPAIGELYLNPGINAAVMGFMAADGPEMSFEEIAFRKITVRAADADGLRVVASKSHMTDETREYIGRFEVKEMKSAGSSLKFCLLARGDADLYPRFGPTMEWDTAAGHAVLSGAGGQVVTEDGTELAYGKAGRGYKNPNFIARAHMQGFRG